MKIATTAQCIGENFSKSINEGGEIMDNTELTEAIIAIILEEVNGYSKGEAILLSKANNGVVEDRIYKLLEEQRAVFDSSQKH